MLKVDGKFALFGFDELEPYFQEFDALVSLHQWSKAREIIEPFYIPELAAPSQQWHLGHDLAVNFAVCLTMSGKAPEAVKVLSPLEDMVDQPAAFYVNHSLALIYTNSYAAAESLCATGLKRFPNNKDLFGNYVIALTSQNKLSQALSCLETLLALGRDIHFLETAALIMNSLADEAGEQDWVTCVKHRKRALDFLLEAKQQNPRFEATRFSLASTFFALEQYDAANAEYLEVAKLCGKNTDLWDSCIAGTARILLDMGAADTSIEFCKKWMPEVGDATELTRSLSIAMTKRHVIRDGQWVIVREALDFFTNAVETDSSYVEDFCYLADLLGRMERYDEAYSLLSRARVKFPRAWLVLYCRGLVEHQQGSNEDALRSLTEASRLAPYKSDPDWKMGKIYKSLGNAQMAAQFHNSCEAKKAQRRKIIEDGLGKP
jgi:tetratricopeptide (TPR) repeat protein